MTTCASCGRDNRTGNRFCSGCGRPLTARCAACGAETEPGAQFCGACGASLVAAAAPAEDAARKIVTIVFADLIGSTALQERLDAESVRRFMDRYYEAMRSAVEAEGGTVTQLLGDGVKAVFGAPRVAEDDALRAVRAAVAMQHAFRKLAEAESSVVGVTGLRVAVNTGEVVASAEREIIGDPVNVAARLQQEARDGDVVVGEPTRRLVGDLVTLAPLGAFAVKGRAEKVSAWRVVSLERPAGAYATAFVGRESELARIEAVWADAIGARRARLVVVLGSPGLGKSRLIGEVARRFEQPATVLFARCEPAGGSTFAPVAMALRAVLRVDDSMSTDERQAAIQTATAGDTAERARIAAGIGALLAGTPASPEETFFVVRRFLAGLASAAPAVLVIDDLQWAEPLLLDLVEHLVQWTSDAPLLVLAAARPDLREARSSLATPGGLVSDVVTLLGLDAAAAMRLAAGSIGAEELPAAVVGRVLTASEGNPLFVGELVRMLVQDGVLVREGERWTTGAAIAALEMPPTIQALLAARIERLRTEERTVLERAAVVGRQFSRAALAELVPRDVSDLDRHLESLRRSELIEPDTGWFLGEPALRFHHVLTRDAAYRGLLKNRRAELHERLADWIGRKVGDAAPHDETIGWHLEQAHQHLAELGPIDAHGRELGERAARYLGAAGRRALARDDVSVAASLLGRALSRLDAADPARADLALDWCEALLSAGEVAAAGAAIGALGRMAHGSPRLRAWHTCFVGQRAALTDPESLRGIADSVAAATEVLTAEGDANGEAKGHFVHAMALMRLGRIGASEAALDRALAAARRGQDRRRANTIQAGVPLAALWGPSPVARASGNCLDVVRVLRITQSAPAVEAVALRCQGVLEALRGRSEAARRMVASSRRMVEELGITQRLLEAEVFAGRIELIEGDAASAEPRLRAAYEGLREHGLGIAAAQAAALLGRALLGLDRAAEAEVFSHESEHLAGDDLEAAIAWRGVRAEALARRGEVAAAVDLARAAVDLAAATDALLFHADARLALAAALRATGRTADAASEEARAIELWETKGATRLAERARRETDRITEAPRPDRLLTRTASGLLERDGGGRLSPDAESGDTALPGQRRQRRRVESNAAVTHVSRLNAALATRNADAVDALLAPGMEVDFHVNAVVLNREQTLDWWGLFFTDEGAALRLEPLAALGESLGVFAQSWQGTAATDTVFAAGVFQRDTLALIEADAEGRARRIEVFDQLADALVRLYERHAELLPEGAQRLRAETTASALAAALRLDLAGIEAYFAPDVEYLDRRTVGLGMMDRDELRRAVRALIEAAPDAINRVDDVLILRPAAALLHITNCGTDGSSGGRFERPFLARFVFGPDGRMARVDQFDVDRDAEVPQFDELTRPTSRPTRRRLRPNAATAVLSRLCTAIESRDEQALPALVGDLQTVHHPTHTEYGKAEVLAHWRSVMLVPDGTLEIEPLATLGDSLVLARQRISGSGFVGRTFDVGPFETNFVFVLEVDERGRGRRAEIFDDDHLGEAAARLYERYAELLPAGPARERAASTARSFRAIATGPIDVARYESSWAPDVEFVDRRTLGLGATHGRDAFLRTLRTLVDAALDSGYRTEDILAARPDAWLRRVTNFGTDRTTGGEFERVFLMLGVFGPDGRVTRVEQFDTDREAEALARFDELAGPTPRPIRRRVRPNAATEHLARLSAAIEARDEQALPALIGDLHTVHHPTQLEYDKTATLRHWRWLMRVPDGSLAIEPLATLGDSLVLARQRTSGSATAGKTFDVGPFEVDHLLVLEVDEKGRARRVEGFEPDHLGDAAVRLYERYAELLPQGPGRERAAATARAAAAVVGPMDPARIEACSAPDHEHVDRRTLGLGTTSGRDELVRALRALVEASPDVSNRIDDILAARPNGWLRRVVNSGTDRTSGGAFERVFLMLNIYGPDGLATRAEQFDVDREAEAVARFDELTAAVEPSRFENTARRLNERIRRAWMEHDWSTIEALCPPSFKLFDRRKHVLLELDRAGYLESMRPIFDLSESRTWDVELLATRGDRLCLVRFFWRGSGRDVGPSELEYLVLFEVDDQGRNTCMVRFDLDDLDAAYADLSERYAKGELAGHPFGSMGRALATNDWETLADVLTPDLVVSDHRRFGWEAMHGPAAYIASLRALVELAPDAKLHVEHVRASDRAALAVSNWVGTREGGEFELPRAVVHDFDPSGRVSRIDFYDLDQIDAAWAHFTGLRTDPLWIPPNAATRARDRCFDAVAAQDWAAVRGLVAADLVLEDRARYAQTSGDVDLLIETLRFYQKEGGRFAREVIATIGDRIALERVVFVGSPDGGDFGDFELEQIVVSEVDTDGRLRRIVRFPPDDRRAAFAEAAELFLAGEAGIGGQAPVAAFDRAVTGGDWEGLRACMTPAALISDRRAPSVLGELDRDQYIQSLRELADLVGNLAIECVRIYRWNARGRVDLARLQESNGGTARIPTVRMMLNTSDCIERFEIFDATDVDRALARFDELSAAAEPSRFENAAWRFIERVRRAWMEQDWSTIETLCPPSFRLFDRRKHVLLELDRTGHLESMRPNFDSSEPRTWDVDLLATRDDRLSLVRFYWRGSGRDVGPTELEYLVVSEVDEHGRNTCMIRFDLDDLDAAYAELDARYAAGEGAGRRQFASAILEWRRSFMTRDWEGLAAGLAPDLVFADHRRLGSGTMRGPAAHVEWMQALVKLAPDVALRIEHLRTSPRAEIAATAYLGTREGGEFEQPRISVVELDRSGRYSRIDTYDLDNIDLALAQFTELSTDPLWIPSNAATRARDRCYDAGAAGDWAGVRGLVSPDMVADDRARQSLTRGGVEVLIETLRFYLDQGGHPTREVIATIGDRITVERVAFVGSTGGGDFGDFELEHIVVAEVDPVGRLCHTVRFNMDDRRAAFAEAAALFLAGEAAGTGGQAPVVAFDGSVTRGDWEGVRASFAPEAVISDRRAPSLLGELDRDQYIESLRAYDDLVSGLAIESIRVYRWNGRGRVDLARLHESSDGGASRIPVVRVLLTGRDRIERFEIFDAPDVDRALARFDELTAGYESTAGSESQHH